MIRLEFLRGIVLLRKAMLASDQCKERERKQGASEVVSCQEMFSGG